MPKNSEEYIVQKSRPLFDLWQSGFTLSEFKILDFYLSRINSRDESTRTVEFAKSDLQQILGVSQIRSEDLSERFANLQRAVICAVQDDKHKVTISLFDKAETYTDDDCVSKATLRCTEAACEYFFNIEKMGYIRYKIKAITKITSLSTYLMFMYIEYNRFRKTWVIGVDDLRQVLGCGNAVSYNEFRVFNQSILKKAHKELTELNCRFEYETVKHGRTVKSIRFTVQDIEECLPKIALDEVIPEYNEDSIIEDIPDVVYKFSVACRMQFDINQLICIYGVISSHKLPDNIKGDTEEEQQFNYFRNIYSKFLSAESKAKAKNRKINNPVDYIIKIIDNDIKAYEKLKHEVKSERPVVEQSYNLDELPPLFGQEQRNREAAEHNE